MDSKRWYIVTVEESPLEQVESWGEVEAQVADWLNMKAPVIGDQPPLEIAVQVWDNYEDRAVLHHTVPWGEWNPDMPLPDKPAEIAWVSNAEVA